LRTVHKIARLTYGLKFVHPFRSHSRQTERAGDAMTDDSVDTDGNETVADHDSKLRLDVEIRKKS
jgi:hypothetical protein